MKFLRTLLASLLSILLASENQVLRNLDNPLLGVSSNVKHTAKTDENAGVWGKQGKTTNVASSSAIKVEKVIAEEIKNLPVVRTNLSPHCLERCVERGLTKKMAEKAIEKGLRYYDPKNKSIVYVLRNGMGSGDHLVLPTVPGSGVLKTIYIQSKSQPLPKHFIPLD